MSNDFAGPFSAVLPAIEGTVEQEMIQDYIMAHIMSFQLRCIDCIVRIKAHIFFAL